MIAGNSSMNSSSDVAVSVAIRVRPLNKREMNQGDRTGAWDIQGNSISTVSEWVSDEDFNKSFSVPPSSFSFDYIFGPTVHTNTVYERFASEVVESAMNGMNGTIFAYGQTSSGKTHTILGNGIEPGLIPLAIDHIFNFILETPQSEFLLRVSYLEIYNEIIRDLLEPTNTHLKIHETLNREVFVGNLTEKVVTSPEDVHQILALGQGNRHVGETNLNEKSSRSHTLFRMVIESRDRGKASASSRPSVGGGTGAIRVSHLNLVDLAGSERAGQTGAEGIRLKEGGHINKSLLSLATVIAKLSEGGDSSNKHIPYRDSKLTRILQNSLGGNAKTAIICNITPSYHHLDETSSTLRFASRAKKIVNKPHVNQIVSDETLLKRYRKEISELKKQLDQYREAESETLNEKRHSLGTSESTTPITPDQDPIEMARVAEKLEELKKMILDSSHVRLQNESGQMKSLKKIRRRTWYPGANATCWDEPDLPVSELNPSPKRRKRDSIVGVDDQVVEVTNVEDLEPIEIVARIEQNLSAVDPNLRKLIDAMIFRYKDAMNSIDSVRHHFQTQRDFEKLESFALMESHEKTIKSLKDEIYAKELESSVETLASSVLATAWTEVAHETQAEKIMAEYSHLRSRYVSLEKEHRDQLLTQEEQRSQMQETVQVLQMNLQTSLDEAVTMKNTLEASNTELIRKAEKLETKNKELELLVSNLESFKENVAPQLQTIEAERDEKALLLDQAHAKIKELSQALTIERNEAKDELQKLRTQLFEKEDMLKQVSASSEEHLESFEHAWSKKLQDLQASYESQVNDLNQKLQKQSFILQSHQEIKDNLEMVQKSQEGEMANLNQTILDLEQAAAQDKVRLTQLEAEIEKNLVIHQTMTDELNDCVALNATLQQEIQVHQQKSTELHSKIAQLEENLSTTQARLAQIEVEKAVLERERTHHQATIENLNQYDEQNSSLRQELEVAQRKCLEMNEKMEYFEQTAAKDKARISRLEEESQVSEQKLKQMSTRCEELTIMLAEHDETITQLRQELDSQEHHGVERVQELNSELKDLSSQLLDVSSERDCLVQQLKERADKLTDLETHIQALQGQIESERDDMKVSFDQSRQELETRKALLSQVESEKTELIEAYQLLKKEYGILQIQEKGLQTQCEESRRMLSAAQEMQTQLEEALSLATSTINHYKTIEEDLNMATEQNEHLSRELEQVQHERDAVHVELDGMKKSLEEMKNKFDGELFALHEELDRREQEREQGISLLTQYNEKVTSLEHQILVKDEEREEIFSKLQKSLQKNQELEQQLIDYERERDKNVNQVTGFEARMNELEAQLNSAQKEIETRLTSYQDLEKQKNALMDELEKTSRALKLQQKETHQAKNQLDELRFQLAQKERLLSNQISDSAKSLDEENNCFTSSQVKVLHSNQIQEDTNAKQKVLSTSTKENTAPAETPFAGKVHAPTHVRTSRLPPGADTRLATGAPSEVKLTKRVSRLKQQAMKDSNRDEGCNQQ